MIVVNNINYYYLVHNTDKDKFRILSYLIIPNTSSFM